ncbi:Putative telomerase ribonucleoprotein complex - RNA-binding protein [Septoria linicola]|uniref:Telomerase reverse transcriptase n=1 Tax=Septoria linicola TaxID=215465 RepID=A0A9Q9B2W4_9PEZI|nr:Putative telomerase ribonucleoprotein complex - RNA-binding protein [Septoria linicola]
MKRKRTSRTAQSSNKKRKTDEALVRRPQHALLHKYYPEVVTLRQYLASRLPKKRRRRLQQYGQDADQEHDLRLACLLDQTLVGVFHHIQIDDNSFADDDITLFTQQVSECDAAPSLTPGRLKQPEIVDFVIWMLFRKQNNNLRPQHLLCQNYQKYVRPNDDGPGPDIVPSIPGVYSSGRHDNVETLKSHPWTAVPDLLGRGSERILGDVFMDCGLFTPIGDSNNLVQLCGQPMSDLPVLCAFDRHDVADDAALDESAPSETQRQQDRRRGFADIRFARHRMLYARPSLNAKGAVRFGLHHVHVLNRFREVGERAQTHHIMKYIFPYQFGLHNVLRADLDSRDTSQTFKDYAVREAEIAIAAHRQKQKNPAAVQESRHLPALPKRLRVDAETLVQRLRKRHSRCAYFALLDHYCSHQSPEDEDTGSPVHNACTMSQVSAFCRAVVVKVFPKEFWGVGDVGAMNRRTVLTNVDRFVHLRRFETLSLHDVLQKMALDIAWLGPRTQALGGRTSMSDTTKRRELLAELLYYLFDSFLMPLIRSHFHVTESNAQRNQLLYFRHDVWKVLSEPAMANLKTSMLEAYEASNSVSTLTARQLGVSHVRLVPKESGMRPIINLRRRVQKLQHGHVVLGRSINSLLTPTFSVLNYEKSRSRNSLGSALFSVDDIFPRLQSYRKILSEQGLLGQRLYFAKVDVQACFDSIPQQRLMQLARRIIGDDEYQIAKYSRAKLLGSHSRETPGFGAKPSWKFITKAVPADEIFDFKAEMSSDIDEGRRRAVYINGLAAKHESRGAMLSLLQEHIESNLIQIGKHLYRQKQGITQGSVVSSLLCSYFYADMERKVLGFVNDGKSVLLRLIDDFLVISTERSVAEKFMRTMHAGIPEYGVEVKLEKSRANFELEIDGKAIPVLTSTAFPYCGNGINTATLDLSKDNDRKRRTNIADSVAVEYSKVPGQTFYRKLQNSLKLQMRAMLLSTSYNSVDTVLSNLYYTFIEVAQKSYHYIRSLPLAKQPPSKLFIRATDDMIKLACVLMKRRIRTSKDVMTYECCITAAQARWLACTAFTDVLRRRQTKHQALLAWLHAQLALPALRAQERVLRPAVGRCAQV